MLKFEEIKYRNICQYGTNPCCVLKKRNDKNHSLSHPSSISVQWIGESTNKFIEPTRMMTRETLIDANPLISES